MVKTIDSISIIGCGTLGSILAYKIVLMSLEKNISINNLYLVDNDSLDIKNLPYLFISETRNNAIFGKPKPEVLKSLLSPINKKLNIISIHDSFPLNDDHNIYRTFMIDCKDDLHCDSRFNIKLNFDGAYASLRTKIDDIELVQTKNKYSFGNSRLHADYLSSICCHMIQYKNISDFEAMGNLVFNFEIGLGGYNVKLSPN